MVLGAELLLAAVSYGAAALVMGLRPKGDASYILFAETLGVALAFRFAAVLLAKLPQRSLRHATALDLICVTKTLAASSLTLAAFLLWCFPRANLSVSFFIVDSAFLLILWFGLHFGARILKTHQAASPPEGARRTLIIGAGDAGIMLLRELALDSKSPSRPVAILDDDPTKWGRTICGLPVRGGTSGIAAVAAELRADEALVCIPSASRGQMRTILDACRRAELPVRTLPPVAELIRQSGGGDRSATTVSRGQLRPPRIEDLLDREAVRVDADETRRLVGGEAVLITGAGGSIGSELSRQVAAAGPQKLLLLDKSENGLFYANLEASEKLGVAQVKPFLADVTDRERVRSLLRAERPSIILHAAAHKHVALMDLYPREAIRNNVIGTRNVAEAAIEFGARRFVNISTDKAVNPRNWMGLSKKLTELCVQELSVRGATLFSNVRFGNVAGSTGSVLRLFWERIERREPIRVTDPRATRFFMSVPEAVHLILRAAALGQGGETFVFEMGEPVNICQLAKTMILYAGLQPGKDLQIEFTGLQPGEKIDEELWESRERVVDSGSENIFVIRGQHPLAEGIAKKIGRMEELIVLGTEGELLEYLCTIFPDFRWKGANLTEASAPAMERAMARSAGAA